MSMMPKDAAADDVTFGQWKISQLCSNLKEIIDRSVDVGDKKQKIDSRIVLTLALPRTGIEGANQVP